jgi:hypothetical protein
MVMISYRLAAAATPPPRQRLIARTFVGAKAQEEEEEEEEKQQQQLYITVRQSVRPTQTASRIAFPRTAPRTMETRGP